MGIRSILCFFSAALLLSCNSYQEKPTSASTLMELNRIVDSARSSHAVWASKPESIAKTLFPQVSSEGSRHYAINSHSTDPDFRTVTVLEEGAIGEGIQGERRVLQFERVEGKWKIAGYQYEYKASH